MSPAIETFIHDIEAIEESDYGDFMRRAVVYLNELRRRLVPANQETLQKLDEMKFYLDYVPVWEVEPTRQRLIKDALVIEAQLRKDYSSVSSL